MVCLHLHGVEDGHGLARLHDGVLIDAHLDHAPVHRRADGDEAVAGRCFAARCQRTGRHAGWLAAGDVAGGRSGGNPLGLFEQFRQDRLEIARMHVLGREVLARDQRPQQVDIGRHAIDAEFGQRAAQPSHRVVEARRARR